MALQIDIQTPFGIPANYWKIGYYADDLRAGASTATLHGYATEQARKEDSEPMAVQQVSITGDDYAPCMDRAAIYAFVKALPEFADAIDA